MEDRPAFEIHLVDFGDRIKWSLTSDDEGEVAFGSVETESDGLDIHGLAWGHAFADANQERNRREADAE